MDVSENSGTPKIIHFNRVFHYKASIWGYHYFPKHPNSGTQRGYVAWCFMWNSWNLHRFIQIILSTLVLKLKIVAHDLQEIWRHCSEAQQLARDLPLFERWSCWLVSILLMKEILPLPWKLQNPRNSGINYLLPTCTVAGAWCLPSTVPSKLHGWWFFWHIPEEQPWLCFTSMIQVLECEVLLDSWPLRQVMKQIYDVVKHNSLESWFLFNKTENQYCNNQWDKDQDVSKKEPQFAHDLNDSPLLRSHFHLTLNNWLHHQMTTQHDSGTWAKVIASRFGESEKWMAIRGLIWLVLHNGDDATWTSIEMYSTHMII